MKTAITFREKVLAIVGRIPKGTILTYKQVADQAGNRGAARAVGSLMAHNTDTSIPCHRVVRSDGSIGEYNGLRTDARGTDAKRKLLETEGVLFTKSGKVLLKK